MIRQEQEQEKKYAGAAFFDLDGTLLDNASDHVPESARLALRKLKENGWLVCLSTGRDMDTHYSRKYLAEVCPDAVIHSNGYKITIGGELLFTHHFDESLLKRLFAYAETEGFSVGTSIGDADYYLYPELKTAADLRWNKSIRRRYRPVSELFEKKIPVLALCAAGPDTFAIMEKTEKAFPELTLFPFNQGTAADVVEKGFSKAEGMEKVCRYFDIDLKNTLAFGDSQNDLPMFSQAATGIAMGNAPEEVKQKADLITDRVDQDGIFNALCRLGLIRP